MLYCVAAVHAAGALHPAFIVHLSHVVTHCWVQAVAVFWQFWRHVFPAFPAGHPAKQVLSAFWLVTEQLFAVVVQGPVHEAASLESGPGFASFIAAESSPAAESTPLPASGTLASGPETALSAPFMAGPVAPSGLSPGAAPSAPPVYVN